MRIFDIVKCKNCNYYPIEINFNGNYYIGKCPKCNTLNSKKSTGDEKWEENYYERNYEE